MDKSKYCGPVHQYDYMGGMQFCNLFMLGLRHHHKLLDFGCGSLRLGGLAIMYLDENNYYGIEPRKKLVDEGIESNHLSQLVLFKNPQFHYSDDCNMAIFGQQFDFIIAQSVFTHMPIIQVSESFASAAEVMKKTSIFLMNYLPGKPDYAEAKWTQHNISYKPATIKKLLNKNGLYGLPVHLIHTHLQNWLMVRK